MPGLRDRSLFLIRALLAALLLAGATHAIRSPAAEVALTAPQSAWLAAHGKVRVGLSRTDWPPFDIVSGEGAYSGITADYLNLLRQRTGIRTETVLFDNWDQVMAAARAGKVDLLGSMGRTPERERFLAFTPPYVSNPAVIITRKDQREIRGMDDLDGRSVAVETGYLAEEILKSRHPRAKRVRVDSTVEALRAVSLGRADAYVGDLIVSTYLIDREYLTNLEVRDQAWVDGGQLHFAVPGTLVELHGILVAGVASLTEEDHRRIRDRWVPVAGRTEAGARLPLSAAERDWIRKHPRIRVGIDPEWEPLEFLDAEGKHSGLASEYVRLMRERLGLNLEVVPVKTWAETVDLAKRRQVDMVAMITRSPERSRYLRFTAPYVSLPIVMVTRNNARFVSDMRSFEGETVAIVQGYFASEHLAENYPGIVQLPVATMDEALEAVNRGYAFAMVGSLATLGPKLQKQYLGKLKVAATLDLLQELRMGVRPDWPQLAALLDKGLASISLKEREALQHKWLSVRIEYGVDWREVAQVAVPIALAVLVVMAVILVANRRLKRQIAETERKDAELKVRLAFQQTLMDTIPSPILFADADARIYGCNRAYEEAFGVRREDLIGVTLLELDLFAPEIRRRLYDDDLTLLAAPEQMLHDEIRATLTDGKEHVLLYWKTAFRLPDGKVGGLLTVLVDISQLKQLQEEAHQARDAADAANRAKSSFLATMSHEIRTPMNAVLGMLELLSFTRLDQDQQRSLGIVRDSARSLLRIIDDILDFSKIEAGKLEIKPEPMSVSDVVNSVFMVYAGVASSKSLLLRKIVDPRISPALRGDPLRLRQILNNFVSNALKFTDQGEVEVRVDLLMKSEGGERLRFSVRDTGIGISEENQRRLFQPFTQAEGNTTRRYGGTGLGLTICRRLAEMMKGELNLQSEPGRGTTMTFTAAFPLADPSELPESDGQSETGMYRALASRRAAPPVAQAQAEGTLILLADDHPTNRLLLIRQLNTMGYAAEVAVDGVAALAMWKSGRYALLITDCHMPEMDGYELAREIRRIEAGQGLARTPIIACTANALQGEAEVCLAAGMDDYVPKPVEMPELMHKLDHWLPLPREDAQADAPIVPGPLAEVSGGDPALEREILLDFGRASQADAEALVRGFEARDLAAVKRAAHRMKGAGRMVGALDLAQACERIEQAAGEGNWSGAIEMKPRVAAELDRLNQYLRNIQQ